MISSILLNIIVGIIAGIISFTYFNKNTIYHGPNSSIVKKKIYHDDDNRCHVLEPKVHICPGGKIIV
jgi:hypothetical protein